MRNLLVVLLAIVLIGIVSAPARAQSFVGEVGLLRSGYIDAGYSPEDSRTLALRGVMMLKGDPYDPFSNYKRINDPLVVEGDMAMGALSQPRLIIKQQLQWMGQTESQIEEYFEDLNSRIDEYRIGAGGEAASHCVIYQLTFYYCDNGRLVHDSAYVHVMCWDQWVTTCTLSVSCTLSQDQWFDIPLCFLPPGVTCAWVDQDPVSFIVDCETVKDCTEFFGCLPGSNLCASIAIDCSDQSKTPYDPDDPECPDCANDL